MDRKKVIDKVIKLLALSNNNPNEAEAKSAANMAAELMAKYDIEVMETKEKDREGFETFNRLLKRKKPIPFDVQLINIISRFNGVAYLIQNSYVSVGRYIFVGRKADVEINDYMIDLVMSQRSNAWKKYLKQFRELYGRAPKTGEQANWMKSYASGVYSKLNAIENEKNKKVQEYGLVPVNSADAALKHFTKDRETKTSRSRGHKFVQDGYSAGLSTNINAGLNNSYNKPIK